MAGDKVPAGYFLKRRVFFRANGLGTEAPAIQAAARRGVERSGHFAGENYLVPLVVGV